MFVSAPMSVITAKKYTGFRNEILKMIKYFKTELPSLKIHYSGTNISDPTGFDSPIKSYTHDIAALESSSIFLLIYPEKSATGALIELGYALKMGIPILIFTPNRNLLPYMVVDLDLTLENAHTFEYNDSGFLNYVLANRSILDLIKDHINF